VSTEKRPTDPTGEVPTDGPHAGGELHPAQQDVEGVVTSAPARTAAATDASSGLGPQSVGPDQDEATLSDARIDDHARSLAEALDLLRASVDHLVAGQRRTTAAAVSLEMRRRSGNTFTPATAGFAAFREFLRFAEGVGAVTLLPPVPGGDIEVLSATASGALTEPTTPPEAAPRPIRRDLWQAFVDWSPQRQRAFDVQTGRVVTLPADKNGSSANDTSEELVSWSENPARFHRIVPLSRDDQLRWMRTFVRQLPSGEERDQLNAALDDDHPLSTFVGRIRTIPGAERSWRRTFTEEVTSAITRWMRQQNLTADIYHMPSTMSGEPARHARAGSPKTGAAVRQSTLIQHKADSPDELRQQVLEAVARMSLSELLRLPIPAEYLLLR
jgi:Uncharacterised protein family (UPF0158)